MLTGEFRPEILPRRGEFSAWGLTLVLLAFWWLLSWRGQTVPSLVRGGTYFMALVAVLISFSNWTERRTRLRLDDEAVTFSNGLRHVRLPWQDIERIQVRRATLGDGHTVEVIGKQAHFHFETLGRVKASHQPVELGFVEGEDILNTLVARCGFKRYEERDGVYYYAP